MRALALTLLLVGLALPAAAQNVTFKSGTVSVGDPVEKLLEVAGTPERIQPFPGMPAFQRYEYFSEGRNVTVTVKDGEITGIGVLDFSSE